jgi:hypothetical protein
MKQTTNEKILLTIIISFIFSLSTIIFVMATPSGPRFESVSTTTSSAFNGTARTDARGTITTLVLNTSQVNTKWKAYVGNVTGKLLLQDANNFTIYEWTVASYTGEVYASRNNSISWLNIGCANSSTILTEDSSLNLMSATQNSINGTFNETKHKSFVVGSIAIPESLCWATYTYNSSGAQIPNSTTASFQEILLQDNSSAKMVYTTPMENNHPGYNNQPYDFQMLVADDDSQATPQTYYFFVELN